MRAYATAGRPPALAALQRWAGELPQAMAYLVDDAARRAGRLRPAPPRPTWSPRTPASADALRTLEGRAAGPRSATPSPSRRSRRTRSSRGAGEGRPGRGRRRAVPGARGKRAAAEGSAPAPGTASDGRAGTRPRPAAHPRAETPHWAGRAMGAEPPAALRCAGRTPAGRGAGPRTPAREALMTTTSAPQTDGPAPSWSRRRPAAELARGGRRGRRPRRRPRRSGLGGRDRPHPRRRPARARLRCARRRRHRRHRGRAGVPGPVGPVNGNVVWFDAGDYLVTAPLVPRSGTVLQGVHSTSYTPGTTPASACRLRSARASPAACSRPTAAPARPAA